MGENREKLVKDSTKLGAELAKQHQAAEQSANRKLRDYESGIADLSRSTSTHPSKKK
jgi:hypothetical protein